VAVEADLGDQDANGVVHLLCGSGKFSILYAEYRAQ
jgi:hypothetical protein